MMIYLASASPRRQELLQQIGVQFEQVLPEIEELKGESESGVEYVERLAMEKAQAGQRMTTGDKPVLGADTIVMLGDEVLEKPRDFEHARQMLKKLSGKQHKVCTAVALVWGEKRESQVVETLVEFTLLSEQDILAYWESGEPRDKAGAYGIQGLGGRFVSFIQGSYSAVVGLPLYETDCLIRDFFTQK